MIFIFRVSDDNLECTVDPGRTEKVKTTARGFYLGSGVFLVSLTRIGVYESFYVYYHLKLGFIVIWVIRLKSKLINLIFRENPVERTT